VIGGRQKTKSKNQKTYTMPKATPRQSGRGSGRGKRQPGMDPREKASTKPSRFSRGAWWSCRGQADTHPSEQNNMAMNALGKKRPKRRPEEPPTKSVLQGKRPEHRGKYGPSARSACKSKIFDSLCVAPTLELRGGGVDDSDEYGHPARPTSAHRVDSESSASKEGEEKGFHPQFGAFQREHQQQAGVGRRTLLTPNWPM